MKNVTLIAAFLLLHLTSYAQLNQQWQDLGPDNLGASIRGLILDNRDSTRQTLYAGVMGGGVWKTTDGGNWWNYLGCTGNYAISCISQASNGVIYIGTGDGIIQPYGTNTDEGHTGNGIYKLDAQDNFVHLDSTSENQYGGPWSAVNRIAINPLNANQIIAANDGGLFMSTDAGANWIKISIAGVSNLSPGLDIKWSNDGSNIFADMGASFSNTQLIRSTDNGNSWLLINNSVPGFTIGPTGRIEIAIAPSNSKTVYLSITSTAGYLEGIYRSSNAGTSWDTIAKGRANFNPLGGQGWYDDAISVSPADSNKIYFGGIAMYTWSPQTGVHQLPDFLYPNAQPGLYQNQFLYVINDKNPEEVYIATDKGVFKSTDAFSNFTSTQFYDRNYHLNGRDFVSIAASRNGQVIGGSNDAQGLLIGNTGNRDFINLNTGIGYCDFSRLDTNFVFMEGYFGKVYESNNQMASFFTALDANIDPYGSADPSVCNGPSTSAHFIAPLLLCETKSAFATSDSVKYIATQSQSAGSVINLLSKTANTEFQYNLPVSLNAGDSIKVPDPVKSNLFLSTNCGVWVKRNAVSLTTPDWYHISNADASCYAITKDGNKVYCGTFEGAIFITSGLNFGHFTNYNMVDSLSTINYLLLENSQPIEGIAVDPANDSTLIVAVGSYASNYGINNIYKSTNSGKTWEAIQVGPAGTHTYCAIIDANNSNNYIVGTEHGIWTSSDSGATWYQDNANMCDVPVYQLRQIPLLSDDCYVLYAATNSRGLWRSYTLTPSGCNTSVGVPSLANELSDNINLYPNPANKNTTVQFVLPETQQVTIQIHDITGRFVQTLRQFLPDGEQKIQLNTSPMQAGTYLVSVETNQGIKTKLLIIEE